MTKNSLKDWEDFNKDDYKLASKQVNIVWIFTYYLLNKKTYYILNVC